VSLRYRPGVPYSEVLPTPALRSLVACYWAVSGPAPEHRVLPDGCVDIVVAGDGRVQVVGTMTRAVVVGPSDEGAVGIRFRPGEAQRLLADAGPALTDRDAALADFWRDDVAEIEDTLLAGLSDRVAARLDAILSRRLSRTGARSDLHVRKASAMLGDGASVCDAATVVGLSERHLSRRFEARVGVAPKTFARVMRLQRAANAIDAGASASRAAAAAGYSDQAHFTREARMLAGVTPRTLMRERLGMSDSFKTNAEPHA
jgi:AraC-like DNA-binding protein